MVLHWCSEYVIPKEGPGTEGPLVQMLDRQRVQQAAADEAKKVVDAAALAAERLVDATKEAEKTATSAAAAAAEETATEAAAAAATFDDFGVLLPDLVILIEIEGVQWLETATCERGFSLRTQRRVRAEGL